MPFLVLSGDRAFAYPRDNPMAFDTRSILVLHVAENENIKGHKTWPLFVRKNEDF